MAKKKFLLPEEVFYQSDPYLIASVCGPGYFAVSLFFEEDQCGGMCSVSCLPEKDMSPEEVFSVNLEKSIDEISDTRGSLDNGRAAVIGVVQPGVEPVLDEAEAVLSRKGIGRISRKIQESEGIKTYVKNWDNSIRMLETEKPGYCRSIQPAGVKEDIIDILIVDDSNLVQNILSRTLQQDARCEVVGIASDAFSATEKLLVSDPDVIVLDVIMPQMNGITFLQNIMAYYPKPVVIFSTMGRSGGKIEKQAMDCGAVDVIDKRSLNLSDSKSTEIIKEKIKQASTYMVMKKE